MAATTAAATAAARPLSSPPVASPRPTPCRHRRAEVARDLSCRASLGPDGPLSALADTRSAPAGGRAYLRKHSCLLFPPPSGRRPLAVVKFLGGAFIGAVPEVTYGCLLELLAQEGFLVVSVPYNVTFDHEAATREVFERFHSCYDALLASGLPEAGLSALDVAELPLYSVGHSNGALLQLLVGSYFSERIPKANAIVSFNNRPASEAVPYFEQANLAKKSCIDIILRKPKERKQGFDYSHGGTLNLVKIARKIGPLFSQLMPMMEASPVYSAARDASALLITLKHEDAQALRIREKNGDAWKALFDLAGGLIREYDQEAVVSASKFIDQLPSVMNQVTEGVSEFKPTPPENREFCKNSYSVPNTLLVKFSIDAIDDTDIIEDILRPRVDLIGGQIKKVVLSGTHLTPCIQDVKWRVGSEYTPADALAQGLKSLALNETRVLSRTIADWFRSL